MFYAKLLAVIAAILCLMELIAGMIFALPATGGLGSTGYLAQDCLNNPCVTNSTTPYPSGLFWSSLQIIMGGLPWFIAAACGASVVIFAIAKLNAGRESLSM